MNINQIDQIIEESEKSSKTSSKLELDSSLVSEVSHTLSSIVEEKIEPRSIPLPKTESPEKTDMKKNSVSNMNVHITLPTGPTD